MICSTLPVRAPARGQEGPEAGADLTGEARAHDQLVRDRPRRRLAPPSWWAGNSGKGGSRRASLCQLRPHVPPPQSRSRAEVPRTHLWTCHPGSQSSGRGRLWALTGLGALAYAAAHRPRSGRAEPRRLLPGLGLLRRERGAPAPCACCAAIAVREERLAWLVMGVGLLTWTAGDITGRSFLADDPDPPYPSVADVLYLAFYPASYVSLLLVARSRVTSFRSSLWLDGAIAGLTVAALIATLAVPADPRRHQRHRHRARRQPRLSRSATCCCSASSWPSSACIGLAARTRSGCSWAGGLALSAVADGIYLVPDRQGHLRARARCSTPLWPASRCSWSRSLPGSRPRTSAQASTTGVMHGRARSAAGSWPSRCSCTTTSSPATSPP